MESAWLSSLTSARNPEVDGLLLGLRLLRMALAQFPELRKLPRREKLKLAEELWHAAVDDASPVSADDRTLLDSRWKAYRAGKSERITLAELERRVARR